MESYFKHQKIPRFELLEVFDHFLIFSALQEKLGGQRFFREGWETFLQEPCKNAMLGSDPQHTVYIFVISNTQLVK